MLTAWSHLTTSRMQPPTRTQDKIAAERLSTQCLSRLCQTASQLSRYVGHTACPRKHGDA
eukprot:10681631-Lingulodinium_polyedra.AAC.1